MQNNNAYEKLLGDKSFQNAVMNVMAKELYMTLNNDDDSGEKDK